ncbi:MAG: hypothetical protein ACJ8EY_08905 [Sphingomicrobium sp.]
MGDRAGTSAQRIRIGLTGLAFAFLLVLLGSAISRSGHDDQINAAGGPGANVSSDEPLAELGVAPGSLDSQANESANNTTAR